MALALQVVSSHLLGALDIEKALSVHEVLANVLLPHAASEAETLKLKNCPRLFVLDSCSSNMALGPLGGRLRTNSPGARFPNSVGPIVTAHSHAAIPLTLGTKVLEQLARALTKSD
jgi:hypothetical protein